MLVRYIITGATTYIFEMFVLFSLKLLDAPSTIAVSISFWIGFFVSFFAQKILTFRNKNVGKKKSVLQITGYSILVGINYLFTITLVTLFMDTDVLIVRTVALIITTAWNFLVYKYILFI